MNLMQRRAFFGTAVALAGGAAITALPFGATPVVLAAKDDLVSKELAKQMKRAVKHMKDGGGSAAVLQSATLLRVWGAQLESIGADALVQKGLRAQMKTFGRSQMVLKPMDHGKVMKELEDYGITKMHPPASLEARGKALDLLLTNGITAKLAMEADSLEALAPRVQARVAVQWWDMDQCNHYQELCDAWWNMAESICPWIALMPELSEVCAALLATYAACQVSKALLCTDINWWWN